ncbi:hypothetical protein [Micromonospora sp. NPDC005299]|uniref:hypothetical protein n=1 Tax=Micromonospora sp. NPDC005299 TaxID=3364231 RepID=UPI0036A966B9
MTDLVLAREQRAESDSQVVLVAPSAQYVHTRWPSPAQMTANGAVAAMALVGGGLLVGGFTGRVDVESPVTWVALVVLYALAWVAIRARRSADSHRADVEVKL